MIKKLLLTLSFIALIAIAFSGTTHKAQAADTITVADELTRLNDLYKEGVITEEEFSKAKSILLNPESVSGKKKKINLRKLTAVERKRLKETEQEELKALKEQLREEKKAERERTIEEKLRIIEEREQVCANDPESKACKKAEKQLTSIYDKLKKIALESRLKAKKERLLEKQVIEERKARIQKQKELEKQVNLEERTRIKAEIAARKAERKRLKAEWKKACLDDPEGKACKDGKPSEKIKKVLKKIEKQLGG